MGTGKVCALTPPTYRYKGWPAQSAAACATAKETPKMAFAPIFPLLAVPSKSIMIWSMAR